MHMTLDKRALFAARRAGLALTILGGILLFTSGFMDNYAWQTGITFWGAITVYTLGSYLLTYPLTDGKETR